MRAAAVDASAVLGLPLETREVGDVGLERELALLLDVDVGGNVEDMTTDPGTLYDAAGGSGGLLRLAHAWHQRVMADEVVSHAFSHGFHPEHSERLAAYWSEALGGRPTYSQSMGDETTVGTVASWTVFDLSAGWRGPRDELLLKSLMRLLNHRTEHGWFYTPDSRVEQVDLRQETRLGDC